MLLFAKNIMQLMPPKTPQTFQKSISKILSLEHMSYETEDITLQNLQNLQKYLKNGSLTLNLLII